MAERPPLPTSAADLPELTDDFWRTLDDGLRATEIALPSDARNAIDRHVKLLLAWNAAINLTALRTPELIARGHVLDSLITVDALRPFKARTVLDLGSGGGFPGLPLACVLPFASLAMVDSIGKKARFLEVAAKEVSAALSTPPAITAIAERAEDLADEADHREAWDIVLARAVGTIGEVVELGLPLVRRGGRVLVWKRDAGEGGLQHEIADARPISQAVGGSSPRVVRLAAAERVGLAGHCLVVIDKRGHTPDRYPRSPSERRR